VGAFALISHSRFYTKRCSQIAPFGELTRCVRGRNLYPRVVGEFDQPPTEILLQVGQMPLLTEERHMRQSLLRMRVTSSPSARLGAATASGRRMKCFTGCSHYSPSRPEFQGSHLEALSRQQVQHVLVGFVIDATPAAELSHDLACLDSNPSNARASVDTISQQEF
jgi:hypothetical protein